MIFAGFSTAKYKTFVFTCHQMTINLYKLSVLSSFVAYKQDLSTKFDIFLPRTLTLRKKVKKKGIPFLVHPIINTDLSQYQRISCKYTLESLLYISSQQQLHPLSSQPYTQQRHLLVNPIQLILLCYLFLIR